MPTRSVSTLSVTLIALAGLAAALAGAAPAPVPAPPLLDEVKLLTAPEMDGRASGTAGNERAARHLAAALREAGLAPAGASGYAMPFAIPTRVRLGEGNRLALEGRAGSRAFALDTDWTPLAGAADGAIEGAVVFAGYGIGAPDLGYDDWAGLDARGKVVLVLEGEPRRADPASPFARAYAAGYGQLPYKTRVARDRGARAVLFVPRPGPGTDTLPPLHQEPGGGGLPTAAITRTTAEAILAAGGRHLAELRDRIDATLAPASAPLPGVQVALAVHLHRESASTGNVVGILPGTDPILAGQAVVVGAHYDHLGRRGQGALDGAHRAEVHPGADDNASGTAALLALARAFAAAGGEPRTLVFVFFSGEELGLLGSEAYLRAPAFPLERTVAMLNLDMVGRMRDRRLYVMGVDSGSGLERVVSGAASGLGLTLEFRGSPDAPSDQLAFYQRHVPALLFHTGVHDDYHRTTDTWEKIDTAGLARVVTLAGRVIDRLARGPAPAFAEVAAPAGEAAVGAIRTGAGPGYLGVAPDPADDAPGVRLSVVQAGTAAARAGMRPGDVVVRFAGVRVYSGDDLRDSITARKPGERVDVVYLRDGRVRVTSAVLGARP